MPHHRLEEPTADLPPEALTADALEERLRSDAEFREVCLFWAQFYTELAAADVDVSPLVEAFVEGLFEGEASQG